MYAVCDGVCSHCTYKQVPGILRTLKCCDVRLIWCHWSVVLTDEHDSDEVLLYSGQSTVVDTWSAAGRPDTAMKLLDDDDKIVSALHGPGTTTTTL